MLIRIQCRIYHRRKNVPFVNTKFCLCSAACHVKLKENSRMACVTYVSPLFFTASEEGLEVGQGRYHFGAAALKFANW